MNVLIGFILWITLAIVSVMGYILNIVALAHHVGFGLLEVLRVIGIFFAPLGVIMGFI